MDSAVVYSAMVYSAMVYSDVVYSAMNYGSNVAVWWSGRSPDDIVAAEITFEIEKNSTNSHLFWDWCVVRIIGAIIAWMIYNASYAFSQN